MKVYKPAMPLEGDIKGGAHEENYWFLAQYLDALAERQDAIGMNNGPTDRKAPAKVPATMRFDADVLTALIQACGRGWQSRVNDALRESLRLKNPG